MRIRMKARANGAEDGIHTRLFEAGKEYDIVPALASVFIREGWAEVVEEAKAVPAAPQNKAVLVAPDNRSKGRR